ncbi:MAG: CRTAC1 family protein [Saprospiraceae bacterium]
MKSIFIFLTSTLFFFGCQPSQDSKESSVPPTKKSITPAPNAGNTVEMIHLVNAATERADPAKVQFAMNAEKIKLLEKTMKSQSGGELINSKYRYALELLREGSTEKSIEMLQSILDSISEITTKDLNKLILKIKKSLAVAYLRKAEQENCLINHTPASCIIPIAKEGQHQLKEGSQKTIKILNDILAQTPQDKDCQYLLNVAHMTLGQYPEKVPSQFLIPPKYFEKSANLGQFKDVAMDVGVDETNLSGGTCIDDFNGDGFLDIIASSWGIGHQIKYFENDKNGSFSDKTEAAGLIGITGGLNLRHADYNNDGFNDFIILRGAWFSEEGKIPNSLIKNNGDGTFTDVTIDAGVYSEAPTQTAVWADFNLDGWLDLFIANESDKAIYAPCELYISNTDGTFRNATKNSGITLTGYFKGVSCGDLNNDGYPDLYLSNYRSENELYLNMCSSGQIKFKPIGQKTKVQKPVASFPTWIFDFNNDGWEDIFVSSYNFGKLSPASLMMDGINTKGHQLRPYIYKNNGDGSFEEVSRQMGLDEPITTMGCNFGDLDNDGYLDFYLATGDPNLFSIVPNRMYQNKGGKTFQDVTYSSGFGHIQKGHAVGFGDLDFDGDQDIYAVMGGAYDGDVYQNILFENPIGNKNNWTNILLEGTVSNRSAIGARLVLTISENGKTRKIYHTIGTGASFGGNSLLAEIGIGKTEVIETLDIIWPNKNQTKTNFNNLPINSYFKITEGANELKVLTVKPTPFAKGNHQHQHH